VFSGHPAKLVYSKTDYAAGLKKLDALTLEAFTAEANRVAVAVKSSIRKITELKAGQTQQLYGLVTEIYTHFGNPVPFADIRLTAAATIQQLQGMCFTTGEASCVSS